MKKYILVLLMAMGLVNSQAFSQTVQAVTITTPSTGTMKASGVNSLSWSSRALYNSGARVIANWSTLFSTDTIAERTVGAGVNIDGVLLKDGAVTFSSPLTIASGGTGASSLASGYIKSNGSVLSSSATVSGSDVSGNISGTSGGLSVNIPISTTTGLQDSLTAARTSPASPKYLGIDNSDGTVTGTMSETILCNISIPAGTVGANDIIELNSFLYSVGVNGTKTYKIYISPNSNSLSGAVLVGTNTHININLSGRFQRIGTAKNSTSSQTWYPTGFSSGDEYLASTTARSTTSINFANNQFYIITCTLAAASDTGGVDNAFYIVYKP